MIPRSLADTLAQLDPRSPDYATGFVDTLLAAACEVHASDVHLTPSRDGLEIRWRRDGVLQPVGTFSRGEASDVITRLKVLAQLLTYRHEIPQEGRIRQAAESVEMRVGTYPTLHGERAVVRLFLADERLQYVADLGFPREAHEKLIQLLHETSGLILTTGPAGSGKTTTCYACLRDLLRMAGGVRSIVSLEDPIESVLEGVAQAQANAAAGFDLATGLRSLMRQDPEVIMVGEIRDRETAQVAFQAALTGHLVFSTFHAATAAGAISRLSDMGIEPYVLRSGLRAIVSQRLVRRLCACAKISNQPQDLLGLPLSQAHLAAACDRCLNSGYRGRMVLAELLSLEESDELGQAILQRADAGHLQRLAEAAGMTPLWTRACQAVEQGGTSPQEIRRVLGFSSSR